MLNRFLISAAICFTLCLTMQSLEAQLKPTAGMMRFADVSAENIVFVYSDDLWIVDREGGMARPMASPPGAERQPRFSPDGSQIAFVGNYDGGRDIYTIATDGGAAQRLTYHPASEKLCDWMPDGKSVLYSSGGLSGRGLDRLYTISKDKPLPTEIPLGDASMGAVNADGDWLAFIPQNSRDHRTWKRYRGGMATDIWLFHLEDKTSKQITDFEGTDSQPMWHKDTVYYASDAGAAHRINIWAYDTKSGERRQVTKFKDFDCKWPSIGPGPKGDGEIVVQNGSQLFLVDLKTEKSKAVSITVPGDRPTVRKQTYDASKRIESAGISSTGKRIVVAARGDLWSLPAKNGSPRNLTKTDSANEREPAWSPDGKTIAFFSDKTGEYELYAMQSNGRGEAKQLTKGNTAFFSNMNWSPDSKKIAYADNFGGLHVYTFEDESVKQIDKSPDASELQVSWSHDSQWVTYAKGAAPDPKTGTSAFPSVWIANVDDGSLHQVTSETVNDMEPTFDRKGDHLFFYSNRGINSPKYEDLGGTWIYSATEVMIAIPLRADVEDPLKPKSDEEEWEDEDEDEESGDDKEEGKKKSGKEKATDDEPKKDESKDESDDDDEDSKSDPDDDDEGDDEEDPEPLVIEFEGIESRAFALPIDQGFFGTLAVNAENQLIYSRVPTEGSDESESIMILDLSADEIEEKMVADEAADFELSADGLKLMAVSMDDGLELWIIDAAAGQEWEDSVSTNGMKVTVDPRNEWRQMFHEAWRLQRQYFYDPNMHGVDWQAIHDHYEPMLKDCVSRRDLSFIIREMISELNVGHSYYRETQLEDGDSSSVGLLGVRFEADKDAYRVAEIFAGSPTDVDARNPFQRAGGKVGDYILAINDVALSADTNPYQAMSGLVGQTISVTVSDDEKLDDEDKRLLLKPMRNTTNLRYWHWIESNRKHVDEKSNGTVGYVYVPDTGTNGQSHLVRQFYAQRHKAALIVDERWNQGGQIPTRFVELLNRPAVGYFARRESVSDTYPEASHQGPKCMLINGMAGSGGDMFPYLFKQAGLGKLVGTRTWGGLVGISGVPGMIDGARVSVPAFAFYENDGTWGVEGHGVDPDVEVIADPAKTYGGGDPQLDAAIELMLSELEKNTYKVPAIPEYPDRSKMGIKPEDK